MRDHHSGRSVVQSLESRQTWFSTSAPENRDDGHYQHVPLFSALKLDPIKLSFGQVNGDNIIADAMERAIKREASSDDDTKLPAHENGFDSTAFGPSASEDFGPEQHLSPDSSCTPRPSDSDLDDRKLPARDLEQHPYDALSPDLFDTRAGTSHDGSSPLGSHHDPADHFQMELMPSSYTDHHAFQHGYHYTHPGAPRSPEYATSMRHASPHASMPTPQRSHPQLAYSPYHHPYAVQPTPIAVHQSSPHVMAYSAASATMDTRYNPVSSPPAHLHAQPATSTGENSSQFRRSPTDEELDDCKTARARQALMTWYQRLEDLYKYRLEHKHCKYAFL
jgi:hypothetical protein